MAEIQNKLQNQEEKQPTIMALGNLFGNMKVKERFNHMLGERSSSFLASIMNIVRENDKLSKATPMSILNAAATAASMDLPINPNLGFAYIIPYEDNNKKICEAQFQMGAKGYVQLALRSGQYKRMTVNEVYEGEICKFNRFTGEMEYGERIGDEVIGYLAYFQLVNGAEQYMYWTKEKVLAHAKKYSAAYKSKYGPKGPWIDNFDEMAKKTVLKTLLRKHGILSIEMQGMSRAILADQAVIGENDQLSYPDGNDFSDEPLVIDVATNYVEEDMINEPDNEEEPDTNPSKDIFGE